MKSHSFFGRLALLAAALIWGSSFFVMKNAVDQIPVYWLLAFRFSVGFVLLSLIFVRKWRLLSRQTLLHGGFLGVILALAYIVQTFGLTDTTPGKNAFLTAVYCVLAPFVNWLCFRARPSSWNWLAAVLCLVGIGLVSLSGDFTIRMGDALTLLSGVVYAVQIVYISHYGEAEDPILLTMLQFGTAALICWGMTLATGATSVALSMETMPELLYLAVFATTVAMLCQNVGQSVTPAAQSSILLSLESVFGVLFSVLFAHEALTPRLLSGFAVIFVAVIISETRLSFLFPQKEAKV